MLLDDLLHAECIYAQIVTVTATAEKPAKRPQCVVTNKSQQRRKKLRRMIVTQHLQLTDPLLN